MCFFALMIVRAAAGYVAMLLTVAPAWRVTASPGLTGCCMYGFCMLSEWANVPRAWMVVSTMLL
eukprot:CAMPEP_0202869172 /NCGR_PEP_ID=MMETSP1391-20130828/12048_1 /ASSEMBLY_ACC=CAM_ASM_000867 /TAXON_ID=1034604 /ORGANISM="Chlamydomonas leiostraca, Strain SAG 11-49" /LENGTH=63 /DNA_ID=CAMNT_0049549441 /DNA_START=343 /DNA_END=534 /DNA_ORIENTATION=+